MKTLILTIAVAAGLVLAACGDSNNSNANNTAAVTPEACGTTIPSQYCTSYDAAGYGYSNATYGAYGYGYYGNGGFAGYGCPMNYQPLYLGSAYGGSSQYTCVMNSYFGYNSGYTPYYAHGQKWAERGGYAAARACSVGGSECGSRRCLGFGSSNMGYCGR